MSHHAEHVAKIMTDWATDMVLTNAQPILAISHNGTTTDLFVNREVDAAKIVLFLRSVANKFEEQETKKQNI